MHILNKSSTQILSLNPPFPFPKHSCRIKNHSIVNCWISLQIYIYIHSFPQCTVLLCTIFTDAHIFCSAFSKSRHMLCLIVSRSKIIAWDPVYCNRVQQIIVHQRIRASLAFVQNAAHNRQPYDLNRGLPSFHIKRVLLLDYHMWKICDSCELRETVVKYPLYITPMHRNKSLYLFESGFGIQTQGQGILSPTWTDVEHGNSTQCHGNRVCIFHNFSMQCISHFGSRHLHHEICMQFSLGYPVFPFLLYLKWLTKLFWLQV